MPDIYNSKIAKCAGIFFRMKQPAITLGQTAYFGVPSYMVSTPWHRHEYAHKAQWQRDGWLKFTVCYLWYHCTRGYAMNPYEIEARKAES